ncbi:MAG: hypothetical protein R2854_25155 [Caldilineaceae bacterium]
MVTEVDKAAAVLYWAVKEMERRYSLLSKVNARPGALQRILA